MVHRPLTAWKQEGRGVAAPAAGGPTKTMPNDTTNRQKVAGTDERITGPFLGRDKYGRADHEYYRCESCGAEAVRKRDLYGCCE